VLPAEQAPPVVGLPNTGDGATREGRAVFALALAAGALIALAGGFGLRRRR
jgi:hypothetical protein